MIEAPVRESPGVTWVDIGFEYEIDTLTVPMFEDLTLPMDPDEREELERSYKTEAFIDSFCGSRLLEMRVPIFISTSRGKSKGKNRKRSEESIPRALKLVEMVQLSFNEYIAWKDGGTKLDGYLDAGVTEEDFMDDARRLNKGMREDRLIIKNGNLVPR